MRIKIAIGVLLALTIIICIIIGVYIYKIEEFSKKEIEGLTEIAFYKVSDECIKEAEELALTNSIEKKVSPNATFIMKTKYLRCGHTTKKYETAPPFTVNLSKNDLQKMYENWEIESFSNNEVIMKKSEEGICNEHYVIREKEGQIVVYNLDSKNNEIIIRETGILTAYLPDLDKSNLKKGIFVVGEGSLNKLIENFE